MPLFAIIYEPGPAWRAGKPLLEQALDPHTAYQRELHRQGRSLFAGPFLDAESGGIAVIAADNESAARHVAANDPAVIDGVFVARVRPWLAMATLESTANAKVVRRLFAAVESRDQSQDVAAQWEQYERAYDADVAIYEAPSLPYGGDYHGRQGIAEHALSFRTTWDPLQTPDERRLEPQFFADGDRVLVLWQHRAHDPKTGESFTMPVVSVYTLRERRIVESRMFHFDAAASAVFLARVRATRGQTSAAVRPLPDDSAARLAIARAVLAAQPFSRLLGADIVAFAAEATELHLPITDQLQQQAGYVHGGVLSYLADNALTFAGGAVLGPDVVTAELKINYCRPATGDRLVARSHVVSSGHSQAIVRCDIFAVSGEEERLCAVAQGTIVTTRRPTP